MDEHDDNDDDSERRLSILACKLAGKLSAALPAPSSSPPPRSGTASSITSSRSGNCFALLMRRFTTVEVICGETSPVLIFEA